MLRFSLAAFQGQFAPELCPRPPFPYLVVETVDSDQEFLSGEVAYPIEYAKFCKKLEAPPMLQAIAHFAMTAFSVTLQPFQKPTCPTPRNPPHRGGDRGNRPFLVFSHRSNDTGSVVAYFESAKVLR